MPTDRVLIEVEAEKAQRWFGRLLERSEDPSGLNADIRELLLESTQGRFDTSTAPDGTPWPALKDGSGRKPLLNTRRMRDDISGLSGPGFVEINASAKQAKWHQEGTDPYVIRPKNGKALSWGAPMSLLSGAKKGKVVGSIVVKEVNHPGLPARAFVGLSADDEAGIDRLAVAWLEIGD